MTTVFCTFRQEGMHAWPDAPVEYRYLRHPHRHEFHVRVEVEVTHENRQIEFVALKQQMHEVFRRLAMYETNEIRDFGYRSCEHLCEDLRKAAPDLDIVAIEVSEDGENGARVTFQRNPANA